MLDYARFAAEEAGKILQIFEEETEIPYPLPKMDLIAVADFPYGAMENWGLLVFRYSNLTCF